MNTSQNDKNDARGNGTDRRGYPGRSRSTRDLAFQLWLFECGRDCVAVADALGLPARNVQRWAKRDDWPGKADQLLVSVMPDLLKQTATNFRLAAFHASKRMLTLAIAAARDGAKLDSKEVQALATMRDSGGFSPLNAAALGELPTDTGSLPAIAASLEELIAEHHQALGLSVTDGER